MAFTFTLRPQELAYVGQGLVRPECVLATAAGDLYTSHWRGGVSRIAPDGRVTHIGAAARDADAPLRPNGIALCRDGSFLLAELGQGGVYRLAPDGTRAPWLLEVDGQPLHATNYLGLDAQERVWITVSTRHEPRQRAFRPDVADGYIVLHDGRGARIVAEGLGFTNECLLDDTGAWLYVNETFARRLTRFRVAPDGALSGRETVAAFGPGTYPDGMAFDVEGGLWITSIVSNRVIRVAPDGTAHVVLEDDDAAYTGALEAAFQGGALTREHLERLPTRHLRHCSSLAFGGPELRTVYLGALLDDRLATFRSPVAGRPPAHWRWGGTG